MTTSLVRAYVLAMAVVGFQPFVVFGEESESVPLGSISETTDTDDGIYRPAIVGFHSTTGVMELTDGTAQYEPSNERFRYTPIDGHVVFGSVADIQIDRASFQFSATFTIDTGPDSGTYRVTMEATDVAAGLALVTITDSNNVTTSIEIEPQMYAQELLGGVATRLPSIPLHPGIGIIVVAVAIFIVAEDAIRGDDAYNCAGFAYYYNGCWM